MNSPFYDSFSPTMYCIQFSLSFTILLHGLHRKHIAMCLSRKVFSSAFPSNVSDCSYRCIIVPEVRACNVLLWLDPSCEDYSPSITTTPSLWAAHPEQLPVKVPIDLGPSPTSNAFLFHWCGKTVPNISSRLVTA
jgi:hypothetical protein